MSCHTKSCHLLRTCDATVLYVYIRCCCVVQAVVTPGTLLNTLWQAVPSFRGYCQQDAQEFLWYGQDTHTHF